MDILNLIIQCVYFLHDLFTKGTQIRIDRTQWMKLLREHRSTPSFPCWQAGTENEPVCFGGSKELLSGRSIWKIYVASVPAAVFQRMLSIAKKARETSRLWSNHW